MIKSSCIVLALSAALVVGCDNDETPTATGRDTNVTTPTDSPGVGGSTASPGATPVTPTPNVPGTPPPTTGPAMGVGGDQAGRDRDNTGINERDRAPGAPTAGMAGQSGSEVDLAAQIRRRITDTEMSVNAQNVKVVVEGNRVVLRGPVNSQQEKDAIGQIANSVAGAGNVDNQLEVQRNP